ncbi:hypothetical protein E4T39_08167 [Aureobasidium subglaciale]|nr:hypothetical protein E4T39_08167 [Aureobasidium subglaciale]
MQDDLQGSNQALLSIPHNARNRLALTLQWFPRRKMIMLKVAIISTSVFLWLLLYPGYHTDAEPLPYTLNDGPGYQAHEDETHHIFRSTDQSPMSRHPFSIKAYDAMSNDCAEQWIAHHQWGPACTGTDLSDGLRVDGVWAWVNGSDPAQIAARQQHKPNKNMHMDAAHRFTEHNELLYSMRSAVASLGPETMQRTHILASAYHGFNGSLDDMAGQVPFWLNKEEALNGKGRVVLHHDAGYFKPMAGPTTNMSAWEVQEWKDAVIPSFNSLAVEAQIQNIDHASSDQLVYYNDDFFTLRKLAVSDFTTPLYGPVIKTLTRITSMYLPAKNTLWRYIKPAGEEPGIKRAGWVLGMRFSQRPLYYITHHPRVLWLPLLREAAQTFPEAFTDTPLSRFRMQDDVPASIQAVFLGSWYVVERHREALLWTWAVAKWGGLDGTMTDLKKERMWMELADEPTYLRSYLNIRVPVRAPIEDPNVFRSANISMPTSTEYSFSSKDGYALSYVDSMWPWNRPRHGYPDLTQGLFKNQNSTVESTHRSQHLKDPSFIAAKACVIVRSTCFDSFSGNETASDFFKRIAFEQPKCGDCIITALIGASGQSGIDKFLPNPYTELVSETQTPAQSRPPHLPLTSDWKTTDFTLTEAIPKDSIHMTLRAWCIRLIQRYSYVLGSVESDFYKVERAKKLEAHLSEVEQQLEQDAEDAVGSPESIEDTFNLGESRGPLAFLCLNDDIRETGKLRDRVDELMIDFFSKMWPSKLSFER